MPKYYLLQALHDAKQAFGLKKLPNTPLIERRYYHGADVGFTNTDEKLNPEQYKDKKTNAVDSLVTHLKTEIARIKKDIAEKKPLEQPEIFILMDKNFGFTQQNVFVIKHVADILAKELEGVNCKLNFLFAGNPTPGVKYEGDLPPTYIKNVDDTKQKMINEKITAYTYEDGYQVGNYKRFYALDPKKGKVEELKNPPKLNRSPSGPQLRTLGVFKKESPPQSSRRNSIAQINTEMSDDDFKSGAASDPGLSSSNAYAVPDAHQDAQHSPKRQKIEAPQEGKKDKVEQPKRSSSPGKNSSTGY